MGSSIKRVKFIRPSALRALQTTCLECYTLPVWERNSATFVIRTQTPGACAMDEGCDILLESVTLFKKTTQNPTHDSLPICTLASPLASANHTVPHQ